MMEQKDFSDRVWCTLLWEFVQFLKEQLDDTAALERQIAAAQELGVFPKGPREIPTVDTALTSGISAVTPTLFLKFLRANTELLDGEGTVEWVRSRQHRYPDDQLRRLVKTEEE
ncbi:MAG: hypothetical protein WBD99_13630 [Thermodesulfobacteriota bacterium]